MRTRVPWLCLLIAVVSLAADPTPWQLYELGRQAEKKGHMAEAYLLYSRARRGAQQPYLLAPRPGREIARRARSQSHAADLR